MNLSLERGNSDGSCVAYVQLGWFVGPRFDDYEAAFRFGRLRLDLMEKCGLERFRARHLRTSVEVLRRSFSLRDPNPSESGVLSLGHIQRRSWQNLSIYFLKCREKSSL